MPRHDRTLTGLPDVVGCCPPVDEPLTADAAVQLAQVFKALGDPVRLRLLSLISAHADGEACVCELSEPFSVSGPTISHHLRVLREAGLITGERRGTWVYYRTDKQMLRRLADAVRPSDLATPAGS